MKKGLFIASGAFGVLAVVLYFASIVKMDSNTARYTGITEVANIQGTVFCAACAIICAVCLVGGLIIHYLENNTPSSSSFTSSSTGIAFHGTTTSDGGTLTSGSYWICPNCKTRNPMSKVECKECGNVR